MDKLTNKNKIFPAIFMFCFLTSLFLYGSWLKKAQAAQTECRRDYCIYSAPSIFKIFRNKEEEKQLRKNEKKLKDASFGYGPDDFLNYDKFISSDVSISAARNELESFQIFISTNVPLQKVKFKISDFIQTANPRAKIPAGNIKAYFAKYIRLDNYPDPKFQPRHDYLFGEWTDPLWPIKPESFSFDINAGDRQPLWFIVNIPKNALPGLYTGKITILPEGKTARSIPVNLTVWRFSLPEKASSKTAFNLGAGLIYRHHKVGRYSKSAKKLMEKYFKVFSDARFSPFFYDRPFGHFNTGIRVVVTEDSLGKEKVELRGLKAFSSLAEKYFTKFGAYPWPRIGYGATKYGSFNFYKDGKNQKVDVNTDPERFENIVSQFVQKFASYLRKRGWLEKSYIFLADEPPKEKIRIIKKVAQAIKKGDPEVKIAIAKDPTDELRGLIDIWLSTSFYGISGDEKGWYYTNLHIPQPGASSRTKFWQLMRSAQITGRIYYYTNSWQSRFDNSANPNNSWFYGNPWINGQVIEGGFNFDPGNGFLFYPPCQSGPCTEPETERIVPSVRWELLREGNEDYEYFNLLAELKDLPEAQRLIGRMKGGGVYPPRGSWPRTITNEIRQMLSLRQQAGELLSANAEKLPGEGIIPTLSPPPTPTPGGSSEKPSNLFSWWQDWVKDNKSGDFNQDGQLGIKDYQILIKNLLASLPTVTVPQLFPSPTISPTPTPKQVSSVPQIYFARGSLRTLQAEITGTNFNKGDTVDLMGIRKTGPFANKNLIFASGIQTQFISKNKLKFRLANRTTDYKNIMVKVNNASGRRSFWHTIQISR